MSGEAQARDIGGDGTSPNPSNEPSVEGVGKTPEQLIIDYQHYINELQFRFPDTYQTLHSFIERGNCKCNKLDSTRPLPPTFTQSGALCTCSSDTHEDCCQCIDLGALCLCHTKHKCTCPTNNFKCKQRKIEHEVRLYEIAHGANTWGNFLNVSKFDAGSADGFGELKKRINLFPNVKYHVGGVAPKKEPELVSHLITVSHLSANVAKPLGGKFNIPADFFNRHLPGTAPISGRLISRLPSSVQIDFEELYETTDTFEKLFPWLKPEDGQQVIESMMKQNFLFGNIGLNYFPVPQDHFDESLIQARKSSGSEILNQEKFNRVERDEGETDGMNVFQFTLTHRISVFSNPPGHPSTAIILFYPKLPVCNNAEHYKGKFGHRFHNAEADSSECKLIKFRSIPDTVPDMLSTTYHDVKADPTHDIEYYRTRTCKQMEDIPFPEGLYRDGMHKRTYASGYDREIKMHLWDHLSSHGRWKQPITIDELLVSRLPESGAKYDDGSKHPDPGTENGDDATFVHLFGAPLFKVVAANWARLIVRRKTDLDILEWKPPKLMGYATVEAIKNRRISIGSHYRDIDASVEVLSGLTQEERPITLLKNFPRSLDRMSVLKLALFETNSQWNRGRSNGFVAGLADNDSWEKVYYDFFELRASVDALSRRASKIQDGIIGAIQVWGGEQASQLNLIALWFSWVILPFSIAGSIFGANITRRPSAADGGYLPDKNWKSFAWAVGGTAIILIATFLTYWGYQSKKPHWITPAIQNLLRRWKVHISPRIKYVLDTRRSGSKKDAVNGNRPNRNQTANHNSKILSRRSRQRNPAHGVSSV